MTATEDRTTLDVHPVAALFPMLADDELYEMTLDIQEHGLLQPIILDAEGRILDGRNRYAACKLGGVEPRFETYDGDDPDAYALSTNITRRHLSTGARAIITAKAARLNGQVPKSGQVAKQADIHRNRLAEANDVLDYAPELVPQIIAGATPLSVALPKARDQGDREIRATAAGQESLPFNRLSALVALGKGDRVMFGDMRADEHRRADERHYKNLRDVQNAYDEWRRAMDPYQDGWTRGLSVREIVAAKPKNDEPPEGEGGEDE